MPPKTALFTYIIKFNFKTNKHMVTVNRNKRKYRCTNLDEDVEQLNMLSNYWTKSKYNYYNAWIFELAQIFDKSKKKE